MQCADALMPHQEAQRPSFGRCSRRMPSLKPRNFLWQLLHSFSTRNAPLFLSTDASNIAFRNQIVDVNLRHLGIISRNLNVTGRIYRNLSCELLAISFAVQHLRHVLEGSHFVLNTDRQPLAHAFSKTQDEWSDK